MQDQYTYDYIIAGAGCAGLSLAVHLVQSGQFSDKKILLVDRDSKQQNDRTWCFWEKEPGLFEELVYCQWEKAWFHSNGFSKLMDLAPYKYKLIRGIDFYNWCHALLQKQPSVSFVNGEISGMETKDTGASLIVNGVQYQSQYIFSSIREEKPVLDKKDYYLLQHFKGRIIETAEPKFTPGEATLMDFRVGQEEGTTFVYVMPFSEKRALVEYTFFTEKLLEPAVYDSLLDKYINNQLGITNYQTTEEEFGVIPMTNHHFPVQKGNIIYTGTAGGQTKASSGYTFRFIQKHAAAITQSLIRTGTPFNQPKNHKRKYRFYDSVLLHVLTHKLLPGDKIFTRLFKKNEPQRVLGFLDNETSLREEIGIISTLPTWPFLKAALHQ